MMRGLRLAAFLLTAAIGVVGAFAVMIRPDPTFAKLLPTMVGTGVSIGVLWWLGPRPRVDESGEKRMAGLDRRQFLTGSLTVGGVAVFAGGLGRMLNERFEISAERADIRLPQAADATPGLPGDAELGVEGVQSFVVPTEDFYRIDTALVVPQVRRESWRLKISGLVDNEIELTYDDLLARPHREPVHGAGVRGGDSVLHLHGLDDEQQLSSLHPVADGDLHG